MGKVSNKSAVEIIPISKVNSNNKTQQIYNQNYLKMQRIPYMSDPTLVPRVQKYLESNVDKTYVDINVMADDLQRSYREYAKRKRSAFRASVKKAYSIVLQSYGLEDHGSSDEDESDDVSESESNRYVNINMNNQLVELFPSLTPRQAIDENELIDISSDDSEVETSNARITNGPSTSHNESHTLPPLNKEQNNDRGKKRKQENNPIKPTPNKKKKSVLNNPEPQITFKHVGGMDKVLEDVCKLMIHIQYPELYKQIGISPPRGFLLHGPPGCGKTLLANAIAGELNVPLIKVAAPELVTGISGESEERIRELFERALNSAPCVLFIDEIDAITPNRQNAQKEMERRIVAQLLSCLDDLSQNENGDRVLVIGATNRPDAIDPALRRAGRFDREICLGIPNVQARAQILKVLTSKLKLDENFDYDSVAKYTPGFVGADLLSLAREAAMIAVNRKISEIKEARKVEQALALQKMLEEKQKREEERLKQEEQRKLEQEAKQAAAAAAAAAVVDETNKSDPEIIVDDEGTKENSQNDQVNGAPANTTDNSIVIIDDDSSKQVNEIPVNGDTKKEEIEPMPVDIGKELTPLEELLLWLHDKTPISDTQLQTICVSMEDFGLALKCVQPSAKREGFATVPDITWDDIGSLREIREELQMTILAPVRHSEQFKALGLSVPTGVLLCGPPGCGKTLLAKAIANEAGINFISVKGPELLNMYVGESERAVRVCFERARNSAPCVIFFDELDALCPKRSDSRENGATMRVVNQMLTEMDGVEGRQGVFLLAASNRPDIVDPAVLRPGRLDKIIFVGLPTASDRVDILRAITKNGTQPQLAPDVDLQLIGKSEQCDGYTGADLAALVREAAVIALKEIMLLGDGQQAVMVTTEHFNKAVSKIRPSVTEKDQKHYEKLRKLYAAIPEQNDVEEMEYS